MANIKLSIAILSIFKISTTCNGFVPATTIKLPYPDASGASRIPRPREEIISTNIVTARNSVGLAVMDQFFKQTPYVAAFVTCSIKASVADVMAQKYENRDNNNSVENTVRLQKFEQASKKKDLSNTGNGDDLMTKIKRNIAFLLYGGLYQGCLQMYIINSIYPVLFGTGNDLLTVLSKSLFDNFVSGPLLSLPLAYAIKGLILKTSIRDSLKKCWHEVRHNGLLTKYWAVWIPTQCLTFSIIPEHLRILFIASVAFFWLIFLSNVTCKEDNDVPVVPIPYEEVCLINEPLACYS